MNTKSYIRIAYKDRREWLKMRGEGIGGSDAASIIGRNPWKSNIELYREKIGLKPKENISNEFTRYGSNVEDARRILFQEKFIDELKLTHTNELIVREDKPYIRASLDGEIEVERDCLLISYHTGTTPGNYVNLKKGMKGIYEAKTTWINSGQALKKWHDKIPDNYFCQVLHYLIAKQDTDFFVVDAELIYPDRTSSENRIYIATRNGMEESIDFLEREEDIFWNEYVLKKIEPPLVF